MVKLVDLRTAGAETLQLAFSDGSHATWSVADLIARDTVMTRPLAGPAFFARALIEPERSPGPMAWSCRRPAFTGGSPRPAR